MPAQPTARAGRSCWPRPVKTAKCLWSMEGDEAIWACEEISLCESLQPTMLRWEESVAKVEGQIDILLETAG